jgi:3-methyladenine DNA glycosylase AlkD
VAAAENRKHNAVVSQVHEPLTPRQRSRLARQVEAELRAAGTPERAVHEKAYLKSTLDFAGAFLPTIRSCARQLRRDHPGLSNSDVFALVDELWTSRLHERRMVAVVLLELYAAQLVPADLEHLERLIRDSYTWALVDSLAGHVVASINAGYPGDRTVDTVLRRWAIDDDLWVRRSALLAHLTTLGRRGSFDGWDRFCQFADMMLDEREFFIRKAIGWVLREASKSHPDLVADWLRPRVSRVSGVTIREAVRYLPESDRDQLIKAYRTR